MGLISGDNIKSIAVGKDITTNAPVQAYDAPGGEVIANLPAGTYLGVCNNAQDDTIFFWGSWWLSFPGNDDLGINAFWVPYSDSTLLVNNKPPRDNAGFNQILPEGIQNIFGSLKNIIIIFIVVAILSAAAFLYFNRKI